MKCKAVWVGPSSVPGVWAVQRSAYLQCWSATNSVRHLVNSSGRFSAWLRGCSSGALAPPFPLTEGLALSAWVETGILGHNQCSSVQWELRSQTAGEGEERSWRYLLLMFSTFPCTHLSLQPFPSHQVVWVIHAHARRRRVGHKSLEGRGKISSGLLYRTEFF